MEETPMALREERLNVGILGNLRGCMMLAALMP